jgi:hypothetical protein
MGVRALTIRGVRAERVELAGDFTDWQPVALERTRGPAWELSVELAPGVYRLNVRIDGGAWQVPRGATPQQDEFGGVVGLIIVREHCPAARRTEPTPAVRRPPDAGDRLAGPAQRRLSGGPGSSSRDAVILGACRIIATPPRRRAPLLGVATARAQTLLVGTAALTALAWPIGPPTWETRDRPKASRRSGHVLRGRCRRRILKTTNAGVTFTSLFTGQTTRPVGAGPSRLRPQRPAGGDR